MARSLKNILLATDGSEGAAHAAAFAARLAADTGAELTVLHVVHFTSDEAVGIARQDRTEFTRILRGIAAPRFEATAEAMGSVEQPLTIHEVAEFGDAAEEILGYAREHDVDLVVVGSRGLTPLSGLLLGSVSEKVARRATCPVTIVH